MPYTPDGRWYPGGALRPGQTNQMAQAQYANEPEMQAYMGQRGRMPQMPQGRLGGAFQGYQAGNQGGLGSTLGSLAGGALGSFFPGIGTALGGIAGGGLGGLYDYYQGGGNIGDQMLAQQNQGLLANMNQMGQQINPDQNIYNQLNQQIPDIDTAGISQQLNREYQRDVYPQLAEQFGGRGSGFEQSMRDAQGDLNTRLATLRAQLQQNTQSMNQGRLNNLAGYQGQFPRLNLERQGALGNQIYGQQGLRQAQQGIGLTGLNQGGQYAGTFGANQANRASNLAAGVGNFQRNALGQQFENVYHQAQPGWAPGVLSALGNFAGNYFGRG